MASPATAAKRSRTRVITVASHKGGSSKTGTAISAAAHLARTAPVLLVDADPQANATVRVGTDHADPDAPDPRELPGLGDAIANAVPAAPFVIGTDHGKLDLLPAGALGGIDVHIARQIAGERAVSRVLDPIVATGTYRWVFVDTAPSQGELARAALVAADAVIAPVPVLSKDAVEGVADLVALLDALDEAGLAPGVFAGIVASRHPGSVKAARALEQLRQWWPVLGVFRERAVWMDAEALRVPVTALAHAGTKLGDAIHAELDHVAAQIKRKVK